ncbi:uncharacterized protein LOC115625127 [Scaptodrosophila lebanonensis]|uniref:Uncharacterized protein LOC115625127 n=1 Tax=Drosophila lebanonensis TaxID=7225 RepID=A0A6J2TGR0_DROLE|nr:uncharacterized protein LOC115625127 [Scaptodrosophila lebanonensis]
MNREVSYGKLKILFFNIFAILYKAAALNIYRLHADLREAKVVVNASTKQDVWIREVFILLISGLLLTRFLLCFLGLATNIIAIYPLLTNTQAELLMPTIIVQCIDNVVLNIYETVLGYCSMVYLQPNSMAVFAVFLAKMMVKIICCISVLNTYADQHHHLSTCNDEDTRSLEMLGSDEIELTYQNLS